MQAFNWKKTNCHTVLVLTSVMCAILFRGVACQGNDITSPSISKENTTRGAKANVSGAGKSQQLVAIPTLRSSTASKVECVSETGVRGKDAVKLKLKNVSSCEENREKIQSILEQLCGHSRDLTIHQEDNTDEMIISGECVEGDVNRMIGEFDNDNIRDKLGVLEADMVNHSQIVLISILVSGLLLAVLLIAACILKTRQAEAKGARLAAEMFQVDEQNQGNTLLSVAPLPLQEPVEKPTSNGESLDSPPTNGHSATQAPVADSEM